MDILIKGMKMPKDEVNLYIRADGSVDIIGRGIMSAYKAVELPPHGDLVEIEKVKEGLRIYGQAGWWERNAPIVLEASK